MSPSTISAPGSTSENSGNKRPALPPLVFDDIKKTHYAVRKLSSDSIQLSTGALHFYWIYEEITLLRRSLGPNRPYELMPLFFLRIKKMMQAKFQQLQERYPVEMAGVEKYAVDFFPLLRLLCPQTDLSRRAFGLKEAKLTQIYKTVFQINRPEAIRR